MQSYTKCWTAGSTEHGVIMTDYERGYEQGKADALKNFDQVEKAMTAFWNLQRQWVGLTMSDMAELRQGGWHNISDERFRVIEAKIKEKNT